MTLYFNRASEKEKRQFLRNRPTKAEVILWGRIKNKQLMGYKFRRQYSVGAFVIDFYCPEVKLAIELDGESHESKRAREYDQERQRYLEQFDIHFLRFRDEQVFDRIESVLSFIAQTLQARKTPLLTKEGTKGRLKRSFT